MENNKESKIVYSPFASIEEQEKAEQGIKATIETDASVEEIAVDAATDINSTILAESAEATALVNTLKDE